MRWLIVVDATLALFAVGLYENIGTWWPARTKALYGWSFFVVCVVIMIVGFWNA
jgi:hypothetical protein